MERKELASYIDTYFAEMHPNFQWKIIKDSTKNIVEVYFTFVVNVPEDIQVQDSEGTVNEPGILQFEDVICFYDPTKSHVSPSHFLIAFPFDIDKGIEQGYVDAVCKHLNIVATQGSASLREFVQTPSKKQFELSWNELNFENTIQTLKDLKRYNRNTLQMDVNVEENFLDKLKGSTDDDDVERI